jgi:hypothetical protein
MRRLSCGLIFALLLGMVASFGHYFLNYLTLVGPRSLRSTTSSRSNGNETLYYLAQPEGRAYLTLIARQIRRESWPFRRISVTRR